MPHTWRTCLNCSSKLQLVFCCDELDESLAEEEFESACFFFFSLSSNWIVIIGRRIFAIIRINRKYPIELQSTNKVIYYFYWNNELTIFSVWWIRCRKLKTLRLWWWWWKRLWLMWICWGLASRTVLHTAVCCIRWSIESSQRIHRKFRIN